VKKYKAKLQQQFMHNLIEIMDQVIREYATKDTNGDRLFAWGLLEVRDRFLDRLDNYRKEYTFSFTHVQAQSLYLLNSVYRPGSPYTANRLRQIADEIHQHYS